MIPARFDYTVVATVPEAIAALQSRSAARVLAGGQNLIPLLRARAANPSLLVDIGRISALQGSAISDERVNIGPLTTHRAMEESETLRRVLPILSEAAALVADPPVRNRGTIGGALVSADPGGDWPAVVLALGARLEATGPDGAREIDIDDFFLGFGATALRNDEILTRITLPRRNERVGMAYGKLRHPASGYALVGVAAVLSADDTGTCRHCRVAVTGVGPNATLLHETGAALEGSPLTPAAIRAAAASAGAGLTVASDIYAGEEYRKHLVRVYVARVLHAAVARAGA